MYKRLIPSYSQLFPENSNPATAVNLTTTASSAVANSDSHNKQEALRTKTVSVNKSSTTLQSDTSNSTQVQGESLRLHPPFSVAASVVELPPNTTGHERRTSPLIQPQYNNTHRQSKSAAIAVSSSTLTSTTSAELLQPPPPPPLQHRSTTGPYQTSPWIIQHPQEQRPSSIHTTEHQQYHHPPTGIPILFGAATANFQTPDFVFPGDTAGTHLTQEPSLEEGSKPSNPDNLHLNSNLSEGRRLLSTGFIGSAYSNPDLHYKARRSSAHCGTATRPSPHSATVERSNQSRVYHHSSRTSPSSAHRRVLAHLHRHRSSRHSHSHTTDSHYHNIFWSQSARASWEEHDGNEFLDAEGRYRDCSASPGKRSLDLTSLAIPVQEKQSIERRRSNCEFEILSGGTTGVLLGSTSVYAKMGGLDKLASYPHIMTPAEVCAFFDVNPETGLTNKQVTELREIHGSNELAKTTSKSMLTLILEQFQDLLVRILLAAAIVSFLLAAFSSSPNAEGITAYVEPFVILLILVANAAICVWQESNAEKSLDALKRLQPELAKVLRDEDWKIVAAGDLVPGDIVGVRVGDKVPADVRIIELQTTAFRCEQSSLTGEAQSVSKDASTLQKHDSDCEIQKKLNMLFASTTVSNGQAVCIVVGTGMSTEIGNIQVAVEAAGGEEEQTPLQQKIDAFGERLSKVIGVICLVVWLINYKNFSDPSHGGLLKGCIYYFKIAVALAVAAIPEGLPAVITTCLALGTRRMAQKEAIVRRLLSVETLGCTTVICSDKTGTLTTNEMCVVQFAVPACAENVKIYSVEGHSYTPVGVVSELSMYAGSTELYRMPTRTIERRRSDRSIADTQFTNITKDDILLQNFALVSAGCNESSIQRSKDGKFVRYGEPTEAAMRILVEKLGCPDEALNNSTLQNPNRELGSKTCAFCNYWMKDFAKLTTLEFSRERKSMSVLVKQKETNEMRLLVKGAPEAVITRCQYLMLPDGTTTPLNKAARESLKMQYEIMANASLRTLALAVKPNAVEFKNFGDPNDPLHERLKCPENFEDLESSLTFLGFVGIMDPPRPGVADAIECCRIAGIRVIMITGDNKFTAEAIAREVGILSVDDSIECRSFTGREFEAFNEFERRDVLSMDGGVVFSRTEPKHKQMVIKSLRELGEITAMTGDGVNDAPALKQADIGVAMGISGTEVAKEASDMVLADDNFSTIVAAIEEGRSIYNNMKAFIRYLISSNIGEVASIFFTAALGIPEGLAPVQLLWVNLVTDGPPATALGFNPPDVDVMLKPPRKRDDSLITPWVFFRYFMVGGYVGIATVCIFMCWFIYGIDANDGNTAISLQQLMHWGRCHSWKDFNVNTVYNMDPNDACTYFTEGKVKASTLSLTVLVVIEMLNALNALSEEGSLVHMPPWVNPYLIAAIFGSIGVHVAILYIPVLNQIFGVVPLSRVDWKHVFVWSVPVIAIDEVLKAVARVWSGRSSLQSVWRRGMSTKVVMNKSL
eukprot:Lankesteria_metandrocarpae@DN4327_c1_g1_i2.p1